MVLKISKKMKFIICKTKTILNLSLVLFVLQTLQMFNHVSAEGGPRKLAIADYKRIHFTHASEQLVLVCPIEMSDSMSFVDWYRGNTSLYMEPGYTITKKGILKVKSVTKEHAGTYICEGVNGYGAVRVNITVIVDNPVMEILNKAPINPNSAYRVNVVPPNIKKRPSTNFIDEVGRHATFHCVAAGQPTPRIFWFLNGHLIKNAEIATESSNGMVHSILKLRELKKSDAGTYKCIARNKVGEDQLDYNLQVTDSPKPPTIVSVEPTDVTVKEGEAVVFWCEVNSKPDLKLHIKWLKKLNKEEIGESVRVEDTTLFRSGTAFYRPLNLSAGANTDTGVYKSKLTIRNSCKEDSGTYVCLALNDKGFNSRNVSLTVIGTAATKSSFAVSYFPTGGIWLVFAVVIAIAIISCPIVVVVHLYCKWKSQKNMTPGRQSVNSENKDLKQALPYTMKHGTKGIGYPEINDPQSNSKLLCCDTTYSYETENQISAVR